MNLLHSLLRPVSLPLLFSGLAAGTAAIAQTYNATPIAAGNAVYSADPYRHTGMLIVPYKAQSSLEIGSGAVVSHPRVVFTCAHFMFEKGQVDPWRTGARWLRATAQTAAPTATSGLALRGYQTMSGYAAEAAKGANTPGALGLDFAVHYAFENTSDGTFAPALADGVAALKSTQSKLILGYPFTLYSAGDSRRFLMHAAGPFTRAFYNQFGDYLGIDDVTTGKGASGGPVWIFDGTTHRLAGVVVSGLMKSDGAPEDFSGVYGIDSSTATLIDAATRLAGGPAPAATAPTITTQPASRRVNAGETATFTVAATGTGTLTYRWQFNGSTITTATSATLTLTGVSLSQAGGYQAIVSNAGGETRSAFATLAVDVPAPTITTQPANVTVNAGANASFTVVANGTGTLSYQWSFTNSAGATSVVAGATGATLTLNAVQAAQAGSYTVTVRNPAGGSVTSRPVTLTLNTATPAPGGGTGPANNAFANAIALSGATVTTTGSNAGATREPGEPQLTFTVGGASVWWSWTAPSNGGVTIATSGSSFDTGLAVYTGTAVSALTRVAEDDDNGSGNTSLVTFNVTSGTTYRIMVDGFGGVTGSIALSLNFTPAASGGTGSDAFTGRQALPAAGGTVTTTNTSATAEAGEPNHAGSAATKSVWFSWTAPLSAPVTITTAGSSFDTRLAVYTGSTLNALTSVAANDDDGRLLTSVVNFTAVTGTVYQIAVDGFNGAAGSITLALSMALPPPAATPAPPTPANDAFSSPAPIGTEGGSFSVSSVAATKEPGEPNHADNRGGASLWWTWTAPASGIATVATTGSNFDTLLAVYLGDTLATLTPFASNDDAEPGVATSSLRFPTLAGLTYRIAVDGRSSLTGNVRLTLGFVPGTSTTPAGPANDSFATRILLPAAGGVTIGDSTGATREAGEPAHAGIAATRSVWYSWTPASNVTCTVSTSGSSFDTILAVYSGTALNTLGAVAANDNEATGTTTSAVRFTAVAGTPYAIAIDGRDGAAGPFRINLTTASAAPTPPTNDAFFNATFMPPAGGVLEGTVAGATIEANEPRHAGLTASRTVWYQWSPTRAGLATISTSGSTFDTVLAVYSGVSVAALTEVASNDDAQGAKTSSVSFAISAGVTYRIAVAAFPGDSGSTVRVNASIAATAEASGVTQNTRLANLSVRGPAGSGADTLVVGFAIAGASAKPVLVRAIGPTLGTFGVTGAMADPVLTVFRGSSAIESNDNWGGSAGAENVAAKAAFVAAFPLSPASRDAAIALNLAPGAYTAQVSAAGTTANGIVLLEAYDTDFNADADANGRKLTNISSRAQVGAGAEALFAGFFVVGPTPKRVLIRGVGPALTTFGVTGVLADPQITVRRESTVVATNDNWSGEAISTAASTAGAFPLTAGSRDAALIAELTPGSYTVELSGVGGGTGVGLIEVYELP